MAGAALLLAGRDVLVQAGSHRNQTRTVELAGATPVRVPIEMGAGELRLEGSAQNLLEADSQLHFPARQPAVKYDVTVGVQRIVSSQNRLTRVIGWMRQSPLLRRIIIGPPESWAALPKSLLDPAIENPCARRHKKHIPFMRPQLLEPGRWEADRPGLRRLR